MKLILLLFSVSSLLTLTLSAEAEKSKVVVSDTVAAPAAKVWEIVSGFNNLPQINSGIVASKLTHGGSVRHLTLADKGGTIVEKLLEYNDAKMHVKYSIIDLIDCGLPVENYVAWVKVEPIDDKSCKVSWTGEFIAKGAPKADAEAAIEGAYKTFVQGTKKLATSK